MVNATTATPEQWAPTPQEMQQWEGQGFIIREGVFTQAECDVLCERVERLAQDERLVLGVRRHENALARQKMQEDGASGGPAMHSITRLDIYDEHCRRHVRDPRLTDVLVHILGPNLVTHNNLFIFKAPSVGLPFPWHQDMWYFEKDYCTPATVGTWQAMDNASVENGCLWVIPGSHHWPILEHDLPGDGPQQQEFRRARVPPEAERDAIPVEVPRGSVLWFHSYLLHRSEHNHSHQWRRAYVTHYMRADAAYVDPERRGWPVTLVRGEPQAGGVHVEPDETLQQADWHWIEQNRPDLWHKAKLEHVT